MIRLQFVGATDPASECIRIFERGWCSHVDAVLPDGTLLGARSDAVGGKPPGVQIRPPGYAIWPQRVVVSLAAPADVESRWQTFLLAQIGKPYDMLAIAAFAAERDWRERDSWFCSELQAAALEWCKWFPAPLPQSANEITPRDLLLAVGGWALPDDGLGAAAAA